MLAFFFSFFNLTTFLKYKIKTLQKNNNINMLRRTTTRILSSSSLFRLSIINSFSSSFSTTQQKSTSTSPLLLTSRRTNSSYISVSATSTTDLSATKIEEDSDCNIDGLDSLASHSFQPDSMVLVSVGWTSSSSSSSPTELVFTTYQNSSSSSNSSEEKKQKSFDISSCLTQNNKEQNNNNNKEQQEKNINKFRTEAIEFLVESSKSATNGTARSVVLLPFQKDNTLQFLVRTLSFVRDSGISFFVASSDAWAQVYLIYAEHRRKIRTFPLPDSLEKAYEHLNDGKEFFSESSSTSKAAYASELALETIVTTVRHLQPPMRSVMAGAQQSSSLMNKRDLAALQVCARVVRPVNYFFIRIDNKMAKSIRDKTAIRIEMWNPQKRQMHRVDLSSLMDTKIQRFEEEVANELNSVSAIFLTPDTEPSAAQAIMRAIRPKNPVFILNAPALASYLDGDDVVVAERFAEGYKDFPTTPRAMWDTLCGAVTSPGVIVRAIVGATYHRLKLAQSFSWHSGSTVPMQREFRGPRPATAISAESSSSSSSAGSASGRSSSSSSRSSAPVIKSHQSFLRDILTIRI